MLYFESKRTKVINKGFELNHFKEREWNDLWNQAPLVREKFDSRDIGKVNPFAWVITDYSKDLSVTELIRKLVAHFIYNKHMQG